MCEIYARDAGIYGVPKRVVANAAYEALIKFDQQFQQPQWLKSVHFVNIDVETTQTFVDVFTTKRRATPSTGLKSSSGAAADASSASSASEPLPMDVCSSTDSTRSGDAKQNGDVSKRQRQLIMDRTPDSAALIDQPSALDAKRPKIDDQTMASLSPPVKVEDCVICMCPITDPKKLPCGHEFCRDCIEQSFDKCQPKCPSCGRLFGVMKGNQPPGTMDVDIVGGSLAGYEDCNIIRITVQHSGWHSECNSKSQSLCSPCCLF